MKKALLALASLLLFCGAVTAEKKALKPTTSSCHVGPDGCTYCSTHDGPVQICPLGETAKKVDIDGINVKKLLADGSDPMPLCRHVDSHGNPCVLPPSAL